MTSRSDSNDFRAEDQWLSGKLPLATTLPVFNAVIRAEQIVAALLEDLELVPVCAQCELEKGKAALGPNQAATHGYCRRHNKAVRLDMGQSEQEAEAKVSHIPHSRYWHDWPR